jgi:hypothetical protein
MISETPVYLQVETRYIPSATQMMSTFEVSSVGFDNKRLTSALKKKKDIDIILAVSDSSSDSLEFCVCLPSN